MPTPLLVYAGAGSERDLATVVDALVELPEWHLAIVAGEPLHNDFRLLLKAANQSPVYLAPEEYEETIVSATERVTTRDLVVEGAVVIETDLASSQFQLTASLDHPGERRTVRVLRHDPDKLAAAIMEILRRG